MLFEKIKDEGVDQLYLVRCANSVESVKSCLSLFRSAIHAFRGTRKQGGRGRRREREQRARAATARGATQDSNFEVSPNTVCFGTVIHEVSNTRWAGTYGSNMIPRSGSDY